jgi:putative ABC transport system ATP-binding protein
MASIPVIEVKNLNHYYGRRALRRQVLFDIDLTVEAGEIIILTGPSGSGKTTLLTLMGGLLSVQEGSLQILGRELFRSSDQEMLRLRHQLGYIFQHHNLVPFFTATQNVQMSLQASQNLSKKVLQERAASMLGAVGLGEFINQYPHKLSGGQKQRVAIARALVAHPPIVLADEPTASLDKVTGRDVVEIMKRLTKQQGCTIILVTHDNRILDVADRIISLEDGRLSKAKGELLLNISNLMSSILDMNIDEISETVQPLSTAQFSEFLEKLNGEFGQLLDTMNLLGNQSLGSKLDLILQTLSVKIAQILQAEQVTFFVVNRVKQTLWSKNARGKGGELISIEIPLTAGIAGTVATTGQSINIPEPYTDSRFNPQVDRDTGFQTRNILCLPMLDSNNEVFAVVQALNKKGDLAFEQEDEERFFNLTRSLGFALQSSILYAQQNHSMIAKTLETDIDSLKAKITSFSVDQFIRFLHGLNQEFEQLLSSNITFENPIFKGKLQSLLQVLSFKIAQVLEAEVVTLFIVNERQQTLRADNAIGKDGEFFTIEIPIETGIAGYVARTGESIIINDPYHDPRFNSQADRDTGFKTRNILSLPVFDSQNNEVTAVVHTLNKSNNAEFDTGDQKKFLELIDALGVVLQTTIRALQKSFTYRKDN